MCAIFSRLSSLPTYYIPHDGVQDVYRDYINMLPPVEHPEVFGQHPNADIASQISETRTLFDTLLSLQPQVTSNTSTGEGPTREEKVSMRSLYWCVLINQKFLSVFLFNSLSTWYKHPCYGRAIWPRKSVIKCFVR